MVVNAYLEGQPEGLVGGPAGGDDGVESLEEGHAAGLALLPLDGPSLVPAHVGGSLNHVVSVPSGDGDEGHSGGVVPDLDKCNMSATISIQYYSCNY